VQQAVLLLAATAIYGVAYSIVVEPVVSLVRDTQNALVALLLICAGTFALWKIRVIARYIHWRLKPQVQNETVEYLSYAGFVSMGYLWLVQLTTIRANYLILSLLISLFILATALACIIASFIIGRLNKSEPVPAPLNILSDTPHEDEPISSQRQTLAALVTILKGAFKHDSDGALAVALDGAWGDGKSSIVGMALKSTEVKPYVVVRFEPWRYTTQEALVAGFYSEIGKAVEAQLPGFQMARFDMAKFAQSFIASADTTGAVKAFFGAYRRRTDNYATKINKHLERHNKKLLVVIDDVDRLHDDSHVMRTLQLAQYLKCDIERSIILFIAEMERIKEAIPSRLRKAYLQKFFDITIMVSQPTRGELVDFINEKLKALEFKADVRLNADNGLLAFLRNLRGAKRVLSMLANDVDNLGENINAQDLFFMRVMYYVYPIIYSDIRDNPSMYFPYSFSFDDRDFGVYGLSEETFEADQIKHFDEVIGGLGLLTADTKRLKALLEDYFPHLKNVFKEPGIGKSHIDERKLYRERRIGTREYLDRYFTYSENVDKRHVAEDKIKRFFERDYKKLTDEKRTQAFIDLYEKHGGDNPKLFFTSLLSVAEDHATDMKDEKKAVLFRDILRTCFKVTGYLVRDNDGSLTRTLGTINRLVNSDNFDLVFDGIEGYMSHPSTGLRLLLYINPTRANHLGSLHSYAGYPDLRKRILKAVDDYYLKQGNSAFAEDNSDEREWRFVLFQWATSVCNNKKEDLDAGRNKKVNDYIAGLVEGDTAQLHDFIMGAFWQNDITAERHRFIFDNSPQAYDVDRFAKIVRKTVGEGEDTLDTEHRKDLEKFIEQYDEFKRQGKADAAPIITSANGTIAWATNFGGVGAAFSAPLKVDNYEGKADFIVDAKIIGTLDDGSQWSSKLFRTSQGKPGERVAIPENDIIEVGLFISDDFEPRRLIPEITSHEAELLVTLRSGKTRTVRYQPGHITKA